MTIKEIVDILDGKVLNGTDRLQEKAGAIFGSDMMSDVLAFAKESSILVTGLCNEQVIRTADMMDMECIIFVRGKMPTDAMVALAREENKIIIATKDGMYHTCGKLYARGLEDGMI